MRYTPLLLIAAGTVSWAAGAVKLSLPSPFDVLAWPPLARYSFSKRVSGSGYFGPCNHLFEPMAKTLTSGSFMMPLSMPFSQ